MAILSFVRISKAFQGGKGDTPADYRVAAIYTSNVMGAPEPDGRCSVVGQTVGKRLFLDDASMLAFASKTLAGGKPCEIVNADDNSGVVRIVAPAEKPAKAK